MKPSHKSDDLKRWSACYINSSLKCTLSLTAVDLAGTNPFSFVTIHHRELYIEPELNECIEIVEM